jgi:protein YIPF5/7
MAQNVFPNINTASGGFYQSSFSQDIGANGTHPSTGGSSNPQYYIPSQPSASSTFEDEPPLLEELGIHLPSIVSKLRSVVNPFTRYEATFADEADMTGPVALCLALGFLLMFQRKIQFGVIYGQGAVGCISIWIVFNLMSKRGIDLYRSTSILGYSLLPMVLLSFLAVFLPIKRVKLLGLLVGGGCIAWSTSTATKIFVAALSMHDQAWLVAYPLLLLYVSFAFITVF